MIVAAYQGPAVPGENEANARVVVEELKHATQLGASFACFPESFLSGYDDTELLLRSCVEVESEWFQDFVNQCSHGDMVSIVGFSEKRGDEHFNSAAVMQGGRLLGVYSKAFCGSEYEAAAFGQGRDFGVFTANGVCFGVVICADGGFIQPSRLMAMQGARAIFSPHYNYIAFAGVETHRRKVRSDHIARARENDCHFVRANSVTVELRKMGTHVGAGYGDSYILDPNGYPLAEAGLFTTGWIHADIPDDQLTGARPHPLERIPRDVWEQYRDAADAWYAHRG
ncbi:MAG: hypothetical protein AUJ92_11125 [Armatimonadetes bacterium CG2_30_59_28]|nr:carbon-nitrogen hydrolase family protein [Armatimonadota bacterium]OIO94005.1 MAG: hypothetical protein AUJ92_11125 [Armatimonadetes bacterium CG2_30_59_28]PIU62399.1 MAG: carbon-nitrogen hydrolase family protein [Armatimonadetes bacterium CG07_land_8_20_14_0_80_59_28]PIY48948.1 MAG: carbon-nitrogen hydrolase family protein [Armatimonadetes bacterium CG_4_10_14_3_um_filter_59_10]